MIVNRVPVENAEQLIKENPGTILSFVYIFVRYCSDARRKNSKNMEIQDTSKLVIGLGETSQK